VLTSKAQSRVFEALVFWRDRVARIRDESVQYVLDDKSLMILTRDCPTRFVALERSFRHTPHKGIPVLLNELRRPLFWEIACALDPHHQRMPMEAALETEMSSHVEGGSIVDRGEIGFGWFQ